jgi:flagellar protein FliO/FliZ
MDVGTYAQFALALVFVLALIGLAALVARRLGLGGGATGGRSRRLGVIETLALDGRRRLVLVRRDNVEHLLVIGSSGETVIESNIGTAPGFSTALACVSANDGEPAPMADAR